MEMPMDQSYSDKLYDGNVGEMLRSYPFPLEEIPRVSMNDPRLYELIKSAKPVVITDTGLVDSSLKWNLEYLQNNIGDGEYFVYTSNNDSFKYYDVSKIKQNSQFKCPSRRKAVSFRKFVQMLKKNKQTNKKIYLQQTLNDSVGSRVVEDFMNFNWHWVTNCQQKFKWGPLSSNLLLIGMEGNITPSHYDEQENFFAQISGQKRCILFSPDMFECMYPHPISHPCDRQSQVDINNPDYKKFPKFHKVCGYEAIVDPGDVLYIPMYWWHYIESIKQETEVTPDEIEIPPVTISVNFWFRSAHAPEHFPNTPLNGQQKVSVMRNIEKLLYSAVGDSNEVGKLLRTMTEGRFTEES